MPFDAGAPDATGLAIETRAEETSDAGYEAEGIDDAWFREHAIAAPTFEGFLGCRRTAYRIEARDVLFCYWLEDVEPYWIVHHLRIYLVNGQKLARILDLPLTVGPLDKLSFHDPPDPGVNVVPLQNGRVLEVRETPPRACDIPAERPSEDASELAHGSRTYNRALRRICGGRGRYRWRDATYVRER